MSAILQVSSLLWCEMVAGWGDCPAYSRAPRDLEADNSVAYRQSQRQPSGFARHESIQFELRDQLDAQFFLVPGRMFIPPEFPQVSLQ
jgi:hypothetical protein